MLKLLRRLIPERSPIRLAYHKMSAIFASAFFGFPGRKLKIIAVTGTSGKSTTTELIWFLLNQSGKMAGMISGIQFHIGDQTLLNETLRTSLRPWTLQKLLKRIVSAGCEYAVVEVSSHAIDQHRIWGMPIHTAVLTNTAHGEHMDYHDNFAEYVLTKAKLFREIARAVLPLEDEQFETFRTATKAPITTFSRKNAKADLWTERESCSEKNISFDLHVQNQKFPVNVPLIGEHNLENVVTAVAAIAGEKNIPLRATLEKLQNFPALPGRLERIEEGQNFTVLVDHTYKPPALEAVLQTLKKISKGRLIVVWGGTGSRLPSFWADAGKFLHALADEIVLTTDDPYKDDPKLIARTVRAEIKRKEGEEFFEIPDRYEAIRYALLTAQKEDIVLIAGRGCEQTQTIGKKVIPFDDRVVAREILQFAKNRK